jgi:hypothetical protein
MFVVNQTNTLSLIVIKLTHWNKQSVGRHIVPIEHIILIPVLLFYCLYISELLLWLLDKPLWSWSYGSWIYNYLCNQSLLPLVLRRCVLDTLSDKVCQWLATDRWFSSGILVSSTNKTDCHDITEILLKVVLKH